MLSFETIEIERRSVYFEKDVQFYYENLGFLVNRGREEFNDVGVPDWATYNQGELFQFMVEAKSKNDGLRPNQLRWIKNHPQILVIIAVEKIEQKPAFLHSHNLGIVICKDCGKLLGKNSIRCSDCTKKYTTPILPKDEWSPLPFGDISLKILHHLSLVNSTTYQDATAILSRGEMAVVQSEVNEYKHDLKMKAMYPKIESFIYQCY